MSKLGKRLSAAVLFAFLASLMLTSVAFADGTITDPEETETRDGCTRSDFGSSQTNACGEVEVTADQAADSPEAPEGWHYVGNSMTITFGDELLLPEAAMMCWAIPAGEETVQVYRLNQFGAWEPVPTVVVDGGVCTLAFYAGTYAPLAAD